MKRILIVLITAASLLTTKSFASDVPYNVEKSFLADFSSAKEINWEQRNGFNIASFSLDGQKQSAVYDDMGVLVVVAKQLISKDLPASLKQDIEKRFSGYFATTIFEMKDGSTTSYFATITNGEKEKIVKAKGNKWVVMDTKKFQQ